MRFDVVGLAFGELEHNGQACRIDQRMDLGGQPPRERPFQPAVFGKIMGARLRNSQRFATVSPVSERKVKCRAPLDRAAPDDTTPTGLRIGTISAYPWYKHRACSNPSGVKMSPVNTGRCDHTAVPCPNKGYDQRFFRHRSGKASSY